MNLYMYVQIYYKVGGRKLSRLIIMSITLYSFIIMSYNSYSKINMAALPGNQWFSLKFWLIYPLLVNLLVI